MSGTISIRDHLADLKKQIDQRQLVIARSLPPGIISQARFEQAIITLCGRNPDLLIKCGRASLIGAVLRAAHLGLDVDPALGQAWVIPFKGEAQFIAGYKGLAQLGWRTGDMSVIKGETVRDGDLFEWEDGTSHFLRHKRLAKVGAQATHAWGMFKVRDGSESTFRVMAFDDIEKIRQAAPSARARISPWITHYEEMAMKTALRHTLKLAPASGERSIPLHKAIDLDQRADLGLKQFNTEDLLDEETKAAEFEEAGSDGDPAPDPNGSQDARAR